jgi:hypothetical protein
LLLVHGGAREPEGIASNGWKKLWEGKRPSDRHNNDIYRLYQRRLRARFSETFPLIEEGGASKSTDEEQWPK